MAGRRLSVPAKMPARKQLRSLAKATASAALGASRATTALGGVGGVGRAPGDDAALDCQRRRRTWIVDADARHSMAWLGRTGIMAALGIVAYLCHISRAKRGARGCACGPSNADCPAYEQDAGLSLLGEWLELRARRSSNGSMSTIRAHGVPTGCRQIRVSKLYH